VKKLIVLFAFVGICFSSFSQNQIIIDSLKADIASLKAGRIATDSQVLPGDTSIIKSLVELSEEYWNFDLATGMEYAQEALRQSEILNYQRGLALAYHSMGTISDNIGDHHQAIIYLKKSIEIRKEISIEEDVAASYLNIGHVYEGIGNYAEGLSNYLAALRIYEKGEVSNNLAGCYLNIGILYARQGKSEEGLKYFETALKLFTALDFKPGIAFAYTNIGAVSSDLGEYKKALKYDSLALNLHTELGNQQSIANAYNNLAFDFEYLGNYPEALKNAHKALVINKKVGDKGKQTLIYMSMGSVYAKQKDYKNAKSHFDSSLALAIDIGSYHDISDIYKNLMSLDSAEGNFEMALENYKNYISARDTVFNQDQTRKFTQQSMQYEFDKKQTIAKQAQAQKDALAAKEAQKQKLVRNSLAGGFLIVLIFASVFFAQRNTIKRGKRLSDDLLLNILPAETAEELKANGKAKARSFDQVTVLFTDFKNFTELSEKLTAHELVSEINFCYSAFDRIIGKYGVEKIKTIGDAYMCAGGLPVTNKTNAVDIVKAGLEIRDFMVEERRKREKEGKTFFEIRIGCNTGSVVAGIVGIKKFSYDIWGDTVNVSARMESAGEPGKVNISETTYQLVNTVFKCEYRGKVPAKGKGKIEMYFAERYPDAITNSPATAA